MEFCLIMILCMVLQVMCENSRVLRECEIETYCTQLHCNVLFQIYSLVVTYLFR